MNARLMGQRSLPSLEQLSTLLEDYTYTCGATLSDLELPDSLSSVCVRDVECYDPLEKLYFSMKYDPICIYCCGDKNLKSTEGYYPQCELCADKTPIAKSLNSQFHSYVSLYMFVHPSTIYFFACFVCQIVSSDHSSCFCVLCIKKSVPTGFTLCVVSACENNE